jgi:hypothetical protein
VVGIGAGGETSKAHLLARIRMKVAYHVAEQVSPDTLGLGVRVSSQVSSSLPAFAPPPRCRAGQS